MLNNFERELEEEVDRILENNTLTAEIVEGEVINYLWSNGQITNSIDIGEGNEYWLKLKILS